MSAQQIPNLLSLRGGLRSRGGRGRGRGSPAGLEHSTSAATQHRKDLDIQATDTDAAVSRLSAVTLGYLNDPYACLFVSGSATRRLPIINRGTYTRTTALDILINAFLSHDGTEPSTKQIVSLGAGTDTRYFRLRDQNKHQHLIYHEFDFPSVSQTKFRTVFRNEHLARGEDNRVLFPEATPDAPPNVNDHTEWGFVRMTNGKPETLYCFHPTDLRHLSNSSLKFRGLREDVPTLVISECCLCYMDIESSKNTVKWFSDRFESLGIILYEPIGSDDSFGQMMVANLAARNIVMPSLKSYKTLTDQRSRLVDLGFYSTAKNSGQQAETIETIWNDWVSAPEKARVDHLEGLDEVEEWQMLARHYAVAWGWRGDTGWENWTRLRDKH